LRYEQLIAPLFDSRYGGMYAWRLPANFLVLRILSFSIDCVRCKERGEHTGDKYSFLNMLTYCVYAPLYIGGPIISFDEFRLCIEIPHNKENVFFYGARWLASFAIMEVVIHDLTLYSVTSHFIA